MSNRILQNIKAIQQRIEAACKTSGRNSNDVQLLLATKTVAAIDIQTAIQSGVTFIGENKVQELKDKFEALKIVPHQTHFIGHLQTNKIKDVLKYADCIQSVDRLALVMQLQKRLEQEDRTVDVMLQINTSYEASKYGAAPEGALNFAQAVNQLDRIHITGLMTVGLFSAETKRVRKCFQLLKNLQQQMLDKNILVHKLSMGMSNDLEIAIEEGATIIRVGTAIFGQRQYPDSYYWDETQNHPR